MTKSTDLLAPYDLSGKIALITGGTSGIGRACVERLIAYGAKVVVTCLENVEDPDVEIKKFSNLRGVTVKPLDLFDKKSINRCFKAIIAEKGRIDFLINNAALGSGTVKGKASNEEMQDSIMLKVNADGKLKMCNQFLK